MRSIARFAAASCLFAAVVLAGVATAGTVHAKGQVKITWLGHAAFEVVSPGGTVLLLDPFLKNNPATPAANKDLSKYKPAVVLVTHSHGDHVGDTEEIAKASGAKVLGTHEFINGLKLPDEQKVSGNVGGTFTFGDVTVTLVPAMHSSEPNGRPVGFILKFDKGPTVYHTGDTWIFGDMALIQELYRPNVLLFNMGGGPYTQNPATAALAIKKYFKPTTIIPMHFGTFPPLAKEEDIRAAFKKDKRLKVLKPGESINL